MYRLSIRYQLRNQGPPSTMEAEQVLENKRNRLQKLIDIFEHQADVFLTHELSEDVQISSLRNYAEYDLADDIDDSGMPADAIPSQFDHRHKESPASDKSGTNSEDIIILLPSSLGWEYCANHGYQSLANKEARLRYAQATDAIAELREVLGFKATLFRTQIRHARVQQTKSRAWATVRSVDATAHEHARIYSMARDAYIKVMDPSGESLEVLPLKVTDLHINTAILGPSEVGQHNEQLPWIWSFGTSTNQDGTWMDDCK